jgi:hypothetical protein
MKISTNRIFRIIDLVQVIFCIIQNFKIIHVFESRYESKTYCWLHLNFVRVGNLYESVCICYSYVLEFSCTFVGTPFLNIIVLGNSKCLWISMATMCENSCGNFVGGVELTFV